MDEKEIEDKIKPLIDEAGFILYDIEILLSATKVIRIFIDKAAGVTVDDCAMISNLLTPILESEESDLTNFVLEVSSPGLTSKLKKPKHFIYRVGSEISIVLKHSEQSKFKGKVLAKILDADEESVEIELLEDGSSHKLNYSDISRARLELEMGNL
ncbi:MAG: ribosome maturation factor RimP [Nitrospinota bacterium]